MADNGIYKRYIPAVIPPKTAAETAWMFIFRSTQILIKDELTQPAIPTSKEVSTIEQALINRQYLGELDGRPCYCMEINDSGVVPAGMVFKDLRALLDQVEEDLFLLAGRASQIVNWNRMSRFCGRCGAMTQLKQGELAKVCPSCEAVYYPRISPAIIVAVMRDDRILLAHNRNFRRSWYSVIAGFVEPGETFEECVAREVMEEVSIRVSNITYFGSQPWPFPDSLMVGFIAEYESGEIIVDGDEIDAADWYSGDKLPPRPNNNTIAGRLIESALFKQKDKC
jgi:NAD+ diphosphatase